MVRTSSVVLPEPGLDTRFSANIPRSAKQLPVGARRTRRSSPGCRARSRRCAPAACRARARRRVRRSARRCARARGACTCSCQVPSCVHGAGAAPRARARARRACRVRMRMDRAVRMPVDVVAPSSATPSIRASSVAAAASGAHAVLLRSARAVTRRSAHAIAISFTRISSPREHLELVAAAARTGLAQLRAARPGRRTACTRPRPAA